MAASPFPGTTLPRNLPRPVPVILAGGWAGDEDGTPRLPRGLAEAAVLRLPRGGRHVLRADGREWLVAPVEGPVPALAVAPLPGNAPGERRRWLRAWLPVLSERLRRRAEADPWFVPLASSPSLGPVVSSLARAAATSLPVLLGGESGTGKEVIAAALHAASGRPGPLVAENCAALPAGLLEAELFGVRRGAFTGAHRDRRGRFLAAHRGTLLLDEIGELPLPLQAKLLRVLEEGSIRALGDDHPRPADVRVIGATRADLPRMVREGGFREDLYWRLAGIEVVLPPLRERRGDLPWLVAALLQRVAAEGLGPGRHLSADALAALESHPFPGNVRELLQVLRRAAILATGPVVSGRTIREALGRDPGERAGVDLLAGERERVRKALAEAGGNKSRAARLLGWSRQRLYRRIAALGLTDPAPTGSRGTTSRGRGRPGGRGAAGREAPWPPTGAGTWRSG